jgi:hypothetical protein
MTTKQPDLAFEALERVTSANRHMERGRLNTALRAIRSAWKEEGGLEDDLPREIELRADAYHDMWPMLTITPTALATHWYRVMKQAQAKTPQQRAVDQLREQP